MSYDTKTLSNCEYDVVTLCAMGYRIKEVAKIQDLSPKTIAAHISRIRRKFSIRRSIDWMRLLRMFPGP